MKENYSDRTGKTVLRLEALVGVAEDLGSVPSTHMEVHSHLLILVSRDLAFSSDTLGHQECTQYIDIHKGKYLYP